jgi:hypothetical protein
MATDAISPDPAAAPPAGTISPVFSFPGHSTEWTLADLQAHLGGIPLKRIRLHPPPGTTTKSDVEAVHARTNRICELIDVFALAQVPPEEPDQREPGASV